MQAKFRKGDSPEFGAAMAALREPYAVNAGIMTMTPRPKHRGVPGQSPEQMVRDLSRGYWKPLRIAEENLRLAKTSYQIKYWSQVVALLIP